MKNFSQILLLLLPFSVIFSQYDGNDFSIGIGYNYTTSSKIFLNPNAPDIFDQNQYFDIGDFQNYSLEIRYRFSDFIILGLSTEYLQNSESGRNLTSPLFIVEDGFEIYPVELSIYYFLPFSTESFKFFFGGGFGFYLGNRTRNFGNIEFEKVESEIGYGIQVSAGMDYLVFDKISIRGEIRFRDPDFKVTNKYNSSSVNYEGIIYSVSSTNLTSRINIDGITFRIGTAFHF
jgi:opacity protein-like surface antigen